MEYESYRSPVLQIGAPEDLVRAEGDADVEGLDEGRADATERKRGLALRAIRLNRGSEGWIRNVFRSTNELFYISTAMDFSGKDPVVFPMKKEDADEAWIPLKEGQTYEFTLGEGAPIYPERPIVSGIAVAITVAESDGELQHAGEVMEKAADAVKTDGGIAKIVKKIAENPGAFAADVVLGAVLEAGKVVGTVLKANRNEHIAFFPATSLPRARGTKSFRHASEAQTSCSESSHSQSRTWSNVRPRARPNVTGRSAIVRELRSPKTATGRMATVYRKAH
jgi:hypothetical protein